MKTSAIALLFLLTAGGAAAAEEAVLTLEEAVRIANDRNTAVAVAQAEVDAAKARLARVATLEELASAEADLAEALGLATTTGIAAGAEPPREAEDRP